MEHTTSLPADPTLDEIRAHLAPLIAANAGFDGWTPAARDLAAEQAGIDTDIAALAFSGGAPAMIEAWFAAIDADMVAQLPRETLSSMKVRARIREQIVARLTIVQPRRDALRRALAILAMPGNAALGARLGWHAADLMWRQAGDTATDYNHYTKRALLAAIYAATVTVFLDDESDDWADTRGFLDRRIEGIMAFEKAKSGFVERTRDLPSLSRFIGRLRYPAR